ncbi:hypothetical protein Tco_0642075 [Tanacetum coccineum]
MSDCLLSDLSIVKGYLTHRIFSIQIQVKDHWALNWPNITPYFDSVLAINVISRVDLNTIKVNEIEYRENNPVAIVKNVHVFVRSFTYLTDFVVLEAIGKFIDYELSNVISGLWITCCIVGRDGMVRLNGAARRSCVGDLKTIEKDGCVNVGDGHRVMEIGACIHSLAGGVYKLCPNLVKKAQQL